MHLLTCISLACVNIIFSFINTGVNRFHRIRKNIFYHTRNNGLG